MITIAKLRNDLGEIHEVTEIEYIGEDKDGKNILIESFLKDGRKVTEEYDAYYWDIVEVIP